MGIDEQRLCLIVRDAADAQIALKLFDIMFEFRPERRILNVVDCAVESVFPMHRHPGAAGPQMGMIVNSEKQIQHTVPA